MTEVFAWLALLILLVLIELATMGLTTIWFAAGALVATIAAACGAPVLVQVILFLVVSVLMLVFTRPVAIRYFNVGRAKTNVDSMLGDRLRSKAWSGQQDLRKLRGRLKRVPSSL